MDEKQSQTEFISSFMLRHTIHSNAPINYMAWSPTGGFLVSLSDNGMIQIWDTKKGKIFHNFAVRPDTINRTVWSPSGSQFAIRSDTVNCIAWSPDGSHLAFCSEDEEIRLWDLQTKEYLTKFYTSTRGITCMSWSPDRETLAVGTFDRTIQLWNIKTGNILYVLVGHSDVVNRVAWSPDGHILASCSDDKTIRFWNPHTGKMLRTLIGHSSAVRCIIWSLKGSMFISSDNQLICIWDSNSGREIRVFEGIAQEITSISLSAYDRLLASKSYDGTVSIWRTDTWQPVETLNENFSNYYWPPSVAFHPKAPVIASVGKADTINLWDIDMPTLLASSVAAPNICYTNAKVVLVGDSGVGKSGLGLVLSRKAFIPTESTHGRYIWNLDNQEIEHNDGLREIREILLWDLAGQPGYRLIHQLHLNEVAVVLIVFDSHNELDPFAGVLHWSRALRTAERIYGKTTSTMKKFLVAARIDRGGKRVSNERIEMLLKDLGLDGYIETSAKEGHNIPELRKKIKEAIDWETLPKVTSTDLFRRIKAFLVSQKGKRRVLSSIEDLYQIYLISKNTVGDTNLKPHFETCIVLLESQGLIKRLGFGNLVLLQPELLDTYASALVNAVRDEPDGLGNILEEKVRVGNFFIPIDERIANQAQEKLLLIAMIEDLLYHEIMLREYGDDGLYLVFPSQSTRDNVDLPNPEGRTIAFAFEGPVQNIYATLAVRLSHSGFFRKKALWRNAITYTTKFNGTCGILLENIDEGRAELTLFFDDLTTEETQFHFEEYVRTHLERKAIPETVERWRIFICSECKTPLSNLQVTRRRERGFNWITCGVCDMRVPLLDHEERLATIPKSIVAEMDHTADIRIERETAKSRIQGKIETKDFDVFLCHNGKDNDIVEAIGQKLKENGILPWLDVWELRPGFSWQRLLEQQIEHIKSAVVFVGRDGIGPWQHETLEAFLSEFARRECPVIPVLLPDAPQEPKLPPFLRNRTWVDFRQQVPNPMELLIWGITGKRKSI